MWFAKNLSRKLNWLFIRGNMLLILLLITIVTSLEATQKHRRNAQQNREKTDIFPSEDDGRNFPGNFQFKERFTSSINAPETGITGQWPKAAFLNLRSSRHGRSLERRRRKGLNRLQTSKALPSQRSGLVSNELRRRKQHFQIDQTGGNAMLCPAWPLDSNTIVNCSNGRRVGSRCWVTCPPGYKLLGSKHRSRRKCRVSKKKNKKRRKPYWSGTDEKFQCVSACQPLRPPPNGGVRCHSESTNHFSLITSKTCEVTCDPGYVNNHPGLRQCQSNGTWSGRQSMCIYRAPSATHRYERHQELRCGDVHALSTYTRDDVLHLAAADKDGDLVRIYSWIGGGFVDQPWQVLNHKRPLAVQAVKTSGGHLWLFVGNETSTSLYRSNAEGKFVFSHTTSSVSMASAGNGNHTNGIHFTSLNGDIYRCTGRNRHSRSVVVVQKMLRKTARKQKFKRVARRKMRPDERIYQCSMVIGIDDHLLVLLTLNRSNGRSRIVVAQPYKNKMSVVGVLRESDLRHLSDIRGFRTADNRRYLVAAQRLKNGQCFVYRGRTI